MERSRIFFPTGDEEMIVGFICCTKGRCSFEECLEAAATHPPQCKFTYPILSAMVKGLRREATEITVTQLLNCLRKVVLEKRRNLYVDPDDLYFQFRGQLFHTLIAANQMPGAIVETRFSREIAGLVISGQPDVIFPEQHKLVDYKSTRKAPNRKEAYANHAMQVNIYRWLVSPIYSIEELEIVYLDMDTVKRIPVPVMKLQRVTSYVAARAKVLKRGLDGGKLPSRVGIEGLWQCNGYCPFTQFCWPRGVPTAEELQARQEDKVKWIRRAVARKHGGYDEGQPDGRPDPL
jgi:CRISPR/Cas system-associated exonuclease Cas4 (RecB family)